MAKPINIFIIYAREDKEEKKILLDFLSPMIEAYNLTIWHDDHIQPGQEWKPNIESRLNITDIFILLVSVNFLNSKFIKQVEFKYAIDRHKENKSIVIPVIIKYCLWDDPLPYDNYSFSLNQLQVLPAEGKPIADWRTADEAYSNIAKGIRSVIIERRANQKNQEMQEEEFWNQAVQKNSVNSYNQYIQNYPQGKFYEEAKNAVIIFEEKEKERIERNKQEIEQAKTTSERKKIEEEILWKSTCDINTIVAYTNYLKKTESGLYREKANKFIAEIKKKNREILAEQDRLLKAERENTFWKKTVTENTSSAFKHYVEEYPDGNYRQAALIAIGNIEELAKKNQEILAENERLLKEEDENRFWEEAKGENTIASYEKYLQSTTSVLFKEKAQEGINQLEVEQREKEEQQLWQHAKTENTISSYNGYLVHYPNGTFSTDADTLIKEIEEAERKQREMQKKNQKAPNPEILKKQSSKKYFLIGGSLVFISIIILLVIKFTTPVTKSSEINKPIDTPGQVVQPATITNNQYSQQPEINNAGTNVNQAHPIMKDSAALYKVKRLKPEAVADQPVVKKNSNANYSTIENKTYPSYSIGQRLAGGIIFYIDQSGQHGLIAAPSDQSKAAYWGCKGIKIAGLIDGSGIGGGKNYTDAILAGCSEDGIAARLCTDLGKGWYLPNYEELRILWNNKGILGNFGSEVYWSSTQWLGSYVGSSIILWEDGTGTVNDRSSAYGVRAIRSF